MEDEPRIGAIAKKRANLLETTLETFFERRGTREEAESPEQPSGQKSRGAREDRDGLAAQSEKASGAISLAGRALSSRRSPVCPLIDDFIYKLDCRPPTATLTDREYPLG